MCVHRHNIQTSFSFHFISGTLTLTWILFYQLYLADFHFYPRSASRVGNNPTSWWASIAQVSMAKVGISRVFRSQWGETSISGTRVRDLFVQNWNMLNINLNSMDFILKST